MRYEEGTQRALMARDKCQKNLTMRSASVCCSIFIVVPTVPSSCFCFYASSFSSSSCHDLCPCVFLCIEKCFVRVFVLMVYLARAGGGRGARELAADLLVPLSLPCPVCVGNLSFADSTNKRFFYAPLLLPSLSPLLAVYHNLLLSTSAHR